MELTGTLPVAGTLQDEELDAGAIVSELAGFLASQGEWGAIQSKLEELSEQARGREQVQIGFEYYCLQSGTEELHSVGPDTFDGPIWDRIDRGVTVLADTNECQSTAEPGE